MISELRKYHVALTLANQHLSQLEPDVRDAVLGNVGSLIAFSRRATGCRVAVAGIRRAIRTNRSDDAPQSPYLPAADDRRGAVNTVQRRHRTATCSQGIMPTDSVFSSGAHSGHRSRETEEFMSRIALSGVLRQSKLATLAEIEGFESTDALIAASAVDSVSPGICTKPDCDYSTEVEPDQDRGWCEVCGQQTVASALILAGLI